ncbi:MAG: hypothetical protein WDM85_00185 [Caulobacteraceae bacterium]
MQSIYPFRDPAGDGAYTDDPAKADPDTRVETPPAGDAWTGIDSVSLGLDHERAHAEVGRWIVRHADLLVAWWNGAPPGGPGRRRRHGAPRAGTRPAGRLAQAGRAASAPGRPGASAPARGGGRDRAAAG